MIFGTTLYMVQNIAFNNIAFSGNQQVFNTEHSKWTVLTARVAEVNQARLSKVL